MKKVFRAFICLALLLEFLFPLGRAHATKSLNAEQKLLDHGYELSETGMREVLMKRDSSSMMYCLKYIEQEQLVNLLPEVESYLDFLESKDYVDEGSKLLVVQCILALDKNMDPEVLDGYLLRIRRLLYDVKTGDKDYRGAPVHAYNALLAAHIYQAIDIYDDLLYLSATDIMKSGEYPFDTKKLFEIYGERVSESDIDLILDAHQDRPERQGYILRRAREHGKRLED